MRNSDPKRQHYIPEMILRRFTDSDGLIWVGDGTKVFPTNPKNAFVAGHLYTKSDFSNAQKDGSTEAFFDSIEKSDEYENHLNEIESKAGPVIEQVVKQARRGRCPQLSPCLNDALKRFIVAQACRTPEAQARVQASHGIEDPFFDAFKQNADLDGYPLPNKDLLYQNTAITKVKRTTLTNISASFAAGDRPKTAQEIQTFLKETGLCISVIRIPDRGFIIGSHGITIIDRRYSGRLGAASWLPVAPDVAIGVTTFPDKEFLVTLDRANDGEKLISAMNTATAKLSERIAGASKVLVHSLMQP